MGTFPYDQTVLASFDMADTGPPIPGFTGYVYHGNTHKVVSNTARAQATGVLASSIWTATVFDPDQYAFIKIDVKPNDGNDVWLDLCVKDIVVGSQGASGTADGYRVRLLQQAGTDIVELCRMDDNFKVTLLSPTFEFNAGDYLGAERVGSELRAWNLRAGVATQIGAVTDTTYLAGGKIGFGNWQSSSTAPTLNDFGGGTIPADPPPPPSDVHVLSMTTLRA